MFTFRRSKVLYWLACASIASLPFIESAFLVRHALGRTMADFSPFLNDEVAYWHQAATFRAVGFDGGYYSAEEHPAAVRRIHFGLHGPGYAIVYGGIGKVTGWYRDTAPRVNAALLAVAMLAFAAIARARLAEMWLLGAVVITFWPVAFFVVSNMQEALHYAAALILAALVARRLAEDKTPRGLRLFGWAFVSLLVLLRPSWIIVLPIWAIADRRGSFRQMMATVATAVLLGVLLTVAFFQVSAPIPGSPITASELSLSGGVAPVLSRLAANIRRLRDRSDLKPTELWHRAVYLSATLLSVAVFGWVVKRRGSARLRPDAVRHAAVHAVNMGAITAAMLVAYAISNMTEFRIIAAHVLFGAAVLVTRRTRAATAVAGLLIAADLAAFPLFWVDFEQVRSSNFRRDLRSQRVLEEIIEGRIVYRPDADGWCNTLLTAQYPPDLVAVPPGIGLTAVRDPERLRLPIKSRYVLLDGQTKSLGGTMKLEHLGDLPYGSVYINHSASCETDQPAREARRRSNRFSRNFIPNQRGSS